MVDVVQVVSDAFTRGAGLDDDAVHWVGLAIRESVVNAMRHGNGNDRRKRVHVEFKVLPESTPCVWIRVRDEGPGFDPSTLPDPLAPENLLKASGRGIFLIRSFMDELTLQRAAEGGMEMVMVKRAGSPEPGA
jgi:serine/threonine-protein kinase RsbW